MIDKETHARIRRLFFAEQWKVGTIARELRLHHRTVEAAIEGAQQGPKGRPVRPSILDPYKHFIRHVLESHPRLRATRIYEMLKVRGYAGSAVVVRRYIRRLRPRRGEAYLKLRTLPGEQAQVDWGSFGKVTVGHARRSLSCFVMVLSHSRAMAARFFYDEKLESFLRGHVLAFEAFGGVPRELLYDNLKSVVLERRGEHIRFHPTLLELAGHYHFAPKPCAPYRASEKGKVERAIQYLRHSFFAARSFSDLADLNAQLQHWLETVAHQRPAPGDPDRRAVKEVFDEERPRLLELPQHPFACEVLRPVRVGKTPYARFDLNDYSVPHTLARHTLSVIASTNRLRILDEEGNVVAEHIRSYDRGQPIEDPAHLEALGAEKARAKRLRGRDRLRQACPHADAFIEALALRGTPLAPQVARLGHLLDRYGPTELDAALADALQRQAISAASIAHILDQRRRQKNAPPPIDVVLPDDERVRTLTVTPHALGPYDTLGKKEEHDDDAC